MLERRSCLSIVIIIALLSCRVAEARPKGITIRHIGIGPVALLSADSVQEEIHLEGEALANVKKVLNSFCDELEASREKAGLPKNGPNVTNRSDEEKKAIYEKE